MASTPDDSFDENATSSPQDHSAKIRHIQTACRNGHLDQLRSLASSLGGLVDANNRRIAWPILLGCRDSNLQPSSAWSTLPPHRDEYQVELDVNRSFVYYPEHESKQDIDRRKVELSNVITAVLRHHPELCYFQGYHDIVQVLLLGLGADHAVPAVARLSLLRIRDFMLPTLAAAEAHLRLIPAILYAADRQLHQHLSGAAQPTPFFALASTLTLYAHDIEEYGDIARLFDYLLASEAAVPVYLFVVIILSRKYELLEIEHDEPEMLHSVLSKLPKPLNLEGLICETQTLFKQHPPERLPHRAWTQVSSSSVLKTTRNLHALSSQTLQDGASFFEKHAAEIHRRDQMQLLRQRAGALLYRYRRPAQWTGAAVVVALFALYFGRVDMSASVLGVNYSGDSFALVLWQKATKLAQYVFPKPW